MGRDGTDPGTREKSCSLDQRGDNRQGELLDPSRSADKLSEITSFSSPIHVPATKEGDGLD